MLIRARKGITSASETVPKPQGSTICESFCAVSNWEVIPLRALRVILFFLTMGFPFLGLMSLQDIDLKVRRIQAHFVIKNYPAARDEARQFLLTYPNSEELLSSYVRALAYCGDEKEMLKAWYHYVEKYPDQSLNRSLIEEMAWGVLNKAAQSPSLIMRQMTLLAALFSQDIKGVNIIFRAMQDNNYAIRAVAVSLAGHLHDGKLIEQMKVLFKQEKTWIVRQKVLHAIGSMKIHDLRPDLERLIASETSTAEEKALAIQALLDLLERVERNEIVRLASSNRAGLRLLACEAIGHFQSNRDLDQLLILASDYHSDVRVAAFQSIGLLRPTSDVQRVIEVAKKGCSDLNFKAAISAAWLLTLYAPTEGMAYLESQLQSEKSEVRLLAAAALKSTGSYGLPLSLKQLDSHPDPYVRLNLAVGLIGQREAVQKSCDEIERLLAFQEDRWSNSEVGLFSAIVNRPMEKEGDPTSTPEMDDQLIRLELLNLMAILKSPQAMQSIRKFLMERSWGVSGAAASLLLMEGDEAAIDLVQELLNDPQPKVRLQAALVLSLWGREENAIQALELGYEESDRDQKIKILESLGRIGSMKSVPFLIKLLNEPSQTTRLIAAMALIQCLNH